MDILNFKESLAWVNFAKYPHWVRPLEDIQMRQSFILKNGFKHSVCYVNCFPELEKTFIFTHYPIKNLCIPCVTATEELTKLPFFHLSVTIKTWINCNLCNTMSPQGFTVRCGMLMFLSKGCRMKLHHKNI